MLDKKAALIVFFVCLATTQLWATTFTNFAVGDVLICFRKTGGANDLVVNAGPISALTNAIVNQKIVITQFTGAQLAYVGTNGISWSAFAWYDDTVTPESAQWTLFVSRARSSLNTQTAKWSASSAAAQQLPANNMSGIPPGAIYSLNFNGLNTPTAVIEPDDSSTYINGQSYKDVLFGSGSDPNFGGVFQGNPEITTANNFTVAGNPVRSDFYKIPPGSGTSGVTYLGYFEFSTNGVMTYTAYPSTAVVAPTIVSIVRTGTTNTITFTTGSSGTYSLCGTNDLSAPKTSWPALSSIAGNGGQRSLTDVSTNGNKFYFIKGQ